MLVQISVEISVQFQKTPIVDIENLAISAANILLIQYIGTPLLKMTDADNYLGNGISIA